LICVSSLSRGADLPVTETPLGNASDYDAVKAMAVGVDSRHLAFLGAKGDKQFVVRDGVAGPAYDWVLPDSLTGTLDLSRLGYIIQNGNDIAAAIDGKIVGHGYYSIGADRIAFSADGKHYAYTGHRGSATEGDCVVVRDGVAGKAYAAAQPVPLFSADGNHLLYVAAPAPLKSCLVVDDKEGPAYDRISAATAYFSPDSQHFAYAASNAGKALAVIDGKPAAPYPLMRMPPMFSPDSKHVAYVSGSDNQLSVILDGVEGPRYDSFTEGSVVFSPDSKHLAYAARRGKQWYLVLDGKEQRSSDAVAGASISFSPDSTRLAYVSLTNGKRFIVIDGKEQPGAFDNVLWPGPIFSPDSKRVAYGGVQSGHQRVVLDAAQGANYDAIAQIAFSPDSKHLTYRAIANRHVLMVVDGKDSPPFDDTTPIVYSADSSHYAYAAYATDHANLILDGVAVGTPYTDLVKAAVPTFSADATVDFLMRRDHQFLSVRVSLPPAAAR
jgi:rRNA maturation protein Nop10